MSDFSRVSFKLLALRKIVYRFPTLPHDHVDFWLSYWRSEPGEKLLEAMARKMVAAEARTKPKEPA